MAAQQESGFSVIVIGAGFAGLSAAQKLLQHSHISVSVLEASQRAGGRAHTQQIGSCGRAELGATWLHGLGGSPIHELALQKGLLTGSEQKAAGRLWGSSQYVQQGASNALSVDQAVIAQRGLSAFTMAYNRSQQKDVIKQSMAEHLREAWDQMVHDADSEEEKQLLMQTFHWRELLQRVIDGCDTAGDMSPACLAHYEELPGPNMGLPCGYSAVVQALADGLPIHYNCQVTRVQWRHDGASVTCSNGQHFTADAVICTLPLGVLKEHHQNLFDPSLPADKADAISRIGMGVVDKLFIDFSPSAACPAERQQMHLPADHQDPSIKSIQLLWQIEEQILAQQPKLPQVASSNWGSAADAECCTISEGQQRHAACNQACIQGGGTRNAVACTDDKAVESGDGTEGSFQHLPGWIRGIHSLRFGGSEFPTSLQRAVSQQHPKGGTANAADVMPPNDLGARAAILNAAPGIPSETAMPQPCIGVVQPHVYMNGGESTDGTGQKSDSDSDIGKIDRDPHVGPWTPTMGCAAAWIAGDAAREMEQASDADLHSGVLSLLDSFPALPLPRAFRVHRTRWGADSFALGSYSYPTAVTRPQDFNILGMPLPTSTQGDSVRPVLLFAGEATDSVHFGTTHGACFSGQRAANRLLDFWKPQ